jgi:hypothetical protein
MRNIDPGKNNAFIQMIRQAEEIWNDYKGVEYCNGKFHKKKQIESLEKKVAKLKEIDWDKEFELLKKLTL